MAMHSRSLIYTNLHLLFLPIQTHFFPSIFSLVCFFSIKIQSHKNQSRFMSKTGKLTKLKSAMKRWPSFSKLARTNSSIAASNESEDKDLHAVFVGKSRRRYLLSSDTICHPLFQELIERSGGFVDGQVVVSCEVVLFEHLLWMLQSGSSHQLGSMEELAEFYYTC